MRVHVFYIERHLISSHACLYSERARVNTDRECVCRSGGIGSALAARFVSAKPGEIEGREGGARGYFPRVWEVGRMSAQVYNVS
mgnify:CR=1 FL=1